MLRQDCTRKGSCHCHCHRYAFLMRILPHNNPHVCRIVLLSPSRLLKSHSRAFSLKMWSAVLLFLLLLPLLPWAQILGSRTRPGAPPEVKRKKNPLFIICSTARFKALARSLVQSESALKRDYRGVLYPFRHVAPAFPRSEVQDGVPASRAVDFFAVLNLFAAHPLAAHS